MTDPWNRKDYLDYCISIWGTPIDLSPNQTIILKCISELIEVEIIWYILDLIEAQKC
jgi:hypothetical protein